MIKLYYRRKKRLRRDIILAIFISVFIHLFFVLLLFFHPDPLNLQAKKDYKKPEKDYIEITEFPVPKEKEPEPPKDSKLLAERDHNAKKESTRDTTTRLSKETVSKPNIPKKPVAAKKPEKKPVKKPEKKPEKVNDEVLRDHKLSSLPKQKWLREKPEKPKRDLNEIGKELAHSTPGQAPTPYQSNLPSKLGAKHVENKEDTVDLNTTQFKYYSYFLGLKKQIEGVWHYPRNAALRGEHGSLNLVFTISSNGYLEDVKIVHSSGYVALDKEAVRARRVASP